MGAAATIACVGATTSFGGAGCAKASVMSLGGGRRSLIWRFRRNTFPLSWRTPGAASVTIRLVRVMISTEFFGGGHPAYGRHRDRSSKSSCPLEHRLRHRMIRHEGLPGLAAALVSRAPLLLGGRDGGAGWGRIGACHQCTVSGATSPFLIFSPGVNQSSSINSPNLICG